MRFGSYSSALLCMLRARAWLRSRSNCPMPLFYFRIRTGRFSGASDTAFELADRDAAWVETTKVCGDLVGSISRNLEQNAEWQMELLDESKKPLYRIRLVAETLDQQS
jgi:hypothetical protein